MSEALDAQNPGMFDRWTNKWPTEVYWNTVDWTPYLNEATILSYGAEVIVGNVTIDQPEPTSMLAGIQKIWLTGGEPGLVWVRCWAKFSDRRLMDVVGWFEVLSEPKA